jgi:methionyl-tRNA formyltransferase
MEQRRIVLFTMNQKGLEVLKAIVRELGPSSIAAVVGAPDPNVRQDFYEQIRTASLENKIPFLDRASAREIAPSFAFAVGWKWIIRGFPDLIVFHDSLLPRYRGFAPLPTALICGEKEVGVTALFASEEYDRGDIIAQKALRVEYPVKVQQVIDQIIPAYTELAVEIARTILSGSPVARHRQDECAATYSLWRDEDDYRIDWSLDAIAIQRFVDALGYPYKGASAELDGARVRILDVVPEPDVKFELRVPGKVAFIRDQLPTVVCGAGLLRLLDVRNDAGTESLLPLRRFRSRFR